MANKKFFCGILALALVFGAVFIACPNDTTNEPDTWSAVERLAQLDGTWKGTFSETIDFSDWGGGNVGPRHRLRHD